MLSGLLRDPSIGELPAVGKSAISTIVSAVGATEVVRNPNPSVKLRRLPILSHRL